MQNLFGLLFIAFLVLKLCGVIAWGWIIVFLPLGGWFICFLLALACVAFTEYLKSR